MADVFDLPGLKGLLRDISSRRITLDEVLFTRKGEWKEAKEVASGVNQYALAARGEKVLYSANGSWSIGSAQANGNGSSARITRAT